MIFCWVVTYWHDHTEPTVTVFNNRESAMKCYNLFKEIYSGCSIDKCEIYTYFEVTNDEQHT